MSSNESKYPKIIIDDDSQSVNPYTKKELTVEEYYDLLHHTHAEFSNGSSAGSSIASEDIVRIFDKLDTLTELVQGQSDDIADIKIRVNNIEAYIEQDIQIDDNSSDSLDPEVDDDL